MRNTLNTKARLYRALRNNCTIKTAWTTFHTFRWFTLGMIILLPIYPSISVLGSDLQSQVGDYDETTIIAAYTEEKGTTPESSRLIISEDGFIRSSDTMTDSPPQKKITPTNTQTVKINTPKITQEGEFYKVQKGDSVAAIATKYKITADALLWANNMTERDDIIAGSMLRIPEKSGVVYTVRQGDTLSTIAAKHKISTESIASANNLSDATSIRAGKNILLPGVTPAPKPVLVAKPIDNKKTSAIVDKKAPSTSKSQTTKATGSTPKDRYAINYTGKTRGFAWGNCTAYVASNKNVTWRGNANQWMRNARAKGIPTGSKAVPGAIIQFSGSGYNRYYGHVGIVVDVTDDTIVVKDMNYRRIGEVTVRKIPKNSASIDGYIYVD